MKVRFSYILVCLCLLLSVLQGQERHGADILYDQGRYQEAIDVCLAELVETPKNINAFCYLTWSYSRLKKWDKALEYARKGMEVSRYDRRMIFAAGEALYYIGKNREALKHFEDYTVFVATTIRKDDVYYYMGEIYIRLGEFNNADIAFSTAVHYNSKNAYWLARLGYAREMAGDYEWSLDAYNKALQLNPNLAEAKQGKNRVLKFIAQT